MKNPTATVMALALVAGFVGVGTAPVAVATGNCSSVFSIADAEALGGRALAANSEEIGVEDVLALTDDEILHVQLDSVSDEIRWTVFEMSGGSCVEFTSGDCDPVGGYPRVITAQGAEQTCTLDAPGSGSKDYWVKYVNPQGDALDYTTWVTST